MVTLQDVKKEYVRGGVTVEALRGISLHIPHGSFFSLMGPSGCGKSTLLNLIAGLDCVTSGTVILDGCPVQKLADAEWTRLRREMIGMVFQAFHLIPGLSAQENVALPLLLRGESGTVVRTRVAESLAVVGMEDRVNHRPHELSGGEQQRVAIARALVHRPKLILADEPTGNLDSEQGQGVISLLRTLQQQLVCTVLLVTHSVVAAREADQQYVLRDGLLDQPQQIG